MIPTKKFLKEFKEFALKGNVMELAIAVIIGGAFQGIITAFTDDFINPIINSIGGAEIGGHFEIFNTGQYIEYGAFITAVINFLIMAFVIFLLMKAVNKILSLGHKKRKQLHLPENAHIATERSISRQQNVCIVHPMSLTAHRCKYKTFFGR